MTNCLMIRFISMLCRIHSCAISVPYPHPLGTVGLGTVGHRWAPLGTVGQAALVGGTMGGMLRENVGALADFS